ncbi:MAG: Gldg family protein, partial [Candidatus Obscuribacterales bacterium]|nr:Gldg family protein [Candidatus Obscuribacterales bacterium]
LAVLKKEFAGFFTSLTGVIFFGTFLAITLFVFFWVETFFARGIADVRPMFEWMPVLLIFLVPALSMKIWSEERRSGTLELLLTSPVSNLELVTGKFLACLSLVMFAVALTLPVPITVSLIGPLDWGPVIGGYVAALFLAAAYSSIGLFVSSKTDNQIVSLLISTLLCGLFFIVGSDPIVGLFDNKIGELLSLVGSGARFESITRGVIDARDLYYYLTIVGVFLSLNVLALEKMRWAGNKSNEHHKLWLLVTTLLIGNFLVGNFWFQQVNFARLDLTAGHIYSISPVTRQYLKRLKEPLLIRGYFSAKTHPKLAPLVPRIEDVLKEFEVAGHGKVRVEFVDPLENPELEKEAGEKYGIKPRAFQTFSKYQASVANSYFDILVKYGDQFDTLTFTDLIEVKLKGEQDLDVELKNPEYDITTAIKKVLTSYQSEGNIFTNISKPVTFKGYISSPTTLPEPLTEFKKNLDAVLADLKKDAGDKFQVDMIDPSADGGKVAKKLKSEYGFRPMALGLLDTNTFWFYLVLESDGQMIQVALPEELDKTGLERSIKAGLKRFSRGFLKTVGISTPASMPPMMQYQMPANEKHFTLLLESLSEQFAVKSVDLGKGSLDDDVDMLIVIAPKNLGDKELFAIDQFLMRGGTIAIASAPYDIDMDKALSCKKQKSGLEELLKHHGISFKPSLVLDSQNAAFPIPVERTIEGFTVQETAIFPYPYFIDVRGKGLDEKSGLIAGLNQITLNWASPIEIDEKANSARQVYKLLSSSSESWTSESLDIQPNLKSYPESGFPPPDQATRGQKLIGVVLEGQFNSYFAGKPVPEPGPG